MLPHTSIDQFREYLHRQGQVDDLKNFTTENVRGCIVDSSERGLKASSLNTKLAALSALGDYCVKTRGARGYLLDENPMKRVRRPKAQAPKEKYLYASEIMALLRAPAEPCERLAVAFLMDTRLRGTAASEACVRDLSFEDDGTVKVGVREKGDRPRTVKLTPYVAEVLLDSLKHREAGPDATLLVNARGAAFSRTSLSDMIARQARRAGITRLRVGAPVRAALRREPPGAERRERLGDQGIPRARGPRDRRKVRPRGLRGRRTRPGGDAPRRRADAVRWRRAGRDGGRGRPGRPAAAEVAV